MDTDVAATKELHNLAAQLVANCAILIAKQRKDMPGQPDGANPSEAIGFATQLVVSAGNEASEYFKEQG
jgi:hypothetical protein